jgi:pantothenate synthetase
MSGKKLLESGERNTHKVKKKIIKHLEKEVFFKIDYVSISSISSLSEINNEIDDDILVSVAVYFENIRLIDNFHFLID